MISVINLLTVISASLSHIHLLIMLLSDQSRRHLLIDTVMMIYILHAIFAVIFSCKSHYIHL